MDSLELLHAGERWYEVDLGLLRRLGRNIIERIREKSTYLYMIPAKLNYYSHLHWVLAKLSDIYSEILSMMAAIELKFDPHVILMSRYMIVNTAYGWILINKFHPEASDLASKLAEELSSKIDRGVAEYVDNVIDRFSHIGRIASEDEMLEYGLVLKSLFAADVISRNLNLDFAETAWIILANSLGLARDRYVGSTELLMEYTVKVRAQYIDNKPDRIDYYAGVKIINIPGRTKGKKAKQLSLEF
jgi:hypothetical protein